VLFTHYIYGAAWGRAYGLLLLICMLISWIGICTAIVLASFLRSSKATESTFTLLVTVMTFISGGMIPTLGPFIREAGKLTPNYYAGTAIKSLMNGGGWPEIAAEAGWLAAAAAVCTAVLVMRIRKAATLA